MPQTPTPHPEATPEPAAGSAVARNMTALYVIRIASSVLPLISMPYVVRILGPAGYGIYAFAQGLMGYFNMLIDYGFNLAATRRISAARNEREEVGRIAAATLAAKLLLVAIGLFILLLLTALVPPVRHAAAPVLLIYGQVVGNALFPLWLYQGKERMVGSSILSLAGSLLATAAIFVVVDDPHDYVTLAALWGTTGILTGGIALLTALRMFRVRLRLPSVADVAFTLKDGTLLSLSAGSATLYTSGNAFLLGLVAPKEVVGFYGAAEKIVRAVQELVNPIQQALYPRLAMLAGRSRELAIDAARDIIAWTVTLGALLTIGIVIGAPLAVSLLLGPEFERSVHVVRLLSPLPLLVAFSSTLTFQVMLPFGLDRALVRRIAFAGLVNVLLALLLAPRWLESGMAVAVVTTELLVGASIALFLRRRGIHLLRRAPAPRLESKLMNVEATSSHTTPVLSIITVTSMGVRELVLRMLRSIYERAANDVPLEVFVVDNASHDGTVAAIRAEFPQVIVIENPVNAGFAPANNQALPHARGKYVLFLNPDTEVGVGTLQRCVAELETDPAVGLVSSRMTLGDGRVQYESGRRDYRLRHLLWESVWLHMFFPRHPVFAAHTMGDWDHLDNRDVEAVSGAFMMVRREIAQQLSGLPEDIFLYHEDLSFCLRVRRAGWRVRYLGEVDTIHYANQSTKRSTARWSLLEGEVKVLLVRERSGWLAGLAARGVLAFRSIVRMLIAAPGFLPGMRGVRERYPRVFHMQAHALMLVWCVAPWLVRPLMPKPGARAAVTTVSAGAALAR